MVFFHVADTRACAISEWHRPREITRSRAIRKGLSTMDREHCETIRVDRDFLFFFLVTLARETVEDRFACRRVRRPRNIVVSQRINPKTRTTLGYRAAFSRRSFTSKLKDDLQVWSIIWGREEEVRVEEDSCSGTVNGRCLEEALRMMPMAKEIWRIILEKLIVQ